MKWLRVCVALVIALVLSLAVTRLRFDTEILNLLPAQISAAQGLKIYQEHFSNARELIITLDAPDAETAETTARLLAEKLRKQTDLVADVVWQPLWQENPALGTELIGYLWLNQPPEVFAELQQRLARTNLTQVLTESREALTTSFSPQDIALRGYDPYGFTQLPASATGGAATVGRGEELFSSADGRFRLLFVEAKPDLGNYKACIRWLTNIQQVVQTAQSAGEIVQEVRLGYTGRPAFVAEIAGGMERDMTGPAGGTLVVIAVLFWLTHRQVRPLLWLVLMLLVTLALTTLLGGLFLGAINVVSIGFASILLGLAEDFGIMVYQESRSHPALSQPALRRTVAPGIFWSTITTAGAFLALNLSALPGLGQLGSLVAIGIIVGAVVMLYAYLPLVLRGRAQGGQQLETGATVQRGLFAARQPASTCTIWSVSLGLLLVGVGFWVWRGPAFDHSPNVLRPKNSSASAALAQIKEQLGNRAEPLWLVVSAPDETAMSQRLLAAENALARAVSNGLIASYTLPKQLWVQLENQKVNRLAAQALVAEREHFRSAALSEGFTTNSLLFMENILTQWQQTDGGSSTVWPTNRASRWVLQKVIAHDDGQHFVLGMIQPTTNILATKELVATWPTELSDQGILLSGWELLGTGVFDMVIAELPRVLVPIFLIVVVSLWFAFRNMKEVVLSLGAIAFSGLLLGALMSALDWQWNLLNLMALPLLLGMGVDFSIHIQLALRRYQGDLLQVRRSVGRALLLAGSTTIAGFGSLAFSSNAGMASLGRVSAVGIGLALLIAVYLLPVWWKTWVGQGTAAPRGADTKSVTKIRPHAH